MKAGSEIDIFSLHQQYQLQQPKHNRYRQRAVLPLFSSQDFALKYQLLVQERRAITNLMRSDSIKYSLEPESFPAPQEFITRNKKANTRTFDLGGTDDLENESLLQRLTLPAVRTSAEAGLE